MPAKKTPARKAPAKKTPARKASAQPSPVADQVAFAMTWLTRKATKHDRENLPRFGITATNALGVSMANIQLLAKQLGRRHELALALWDTQCYEARLLASFVDEPQRVTAAQMDRWCRDFDNWGICDTLCFKLFDQTAHAWPMVTTWSTRRNEFEKRAAFALLASLALHDKAATDAQLLHGLTLIERAANDDRNFVWKGVNWALRSVGRRNAQVRAAAIALSARLAESPVQAERWVGKGALKELQKRP
ncbi:MAG: DNA alkylation repair protein [Gemmatimonas sp.]